MKRREACIEFELFAQKANVQTLKQTLKKQSAEHIVAQYETKKCLRYTPYMIPNPNPNPYPLPDPDPKP